MPETNRRLFIQGTMALGVASFIALPPVRALAETIDDIKKRG